MIFLYGGIGMEYTVKKLAEMAGVSSRTIRYYDQVGILKPARINSSGYRIYGNDEVNRLQQILFFRELDFPIDKIKDILASPDYDEIAALKSHREKLLNERLRLDLLINNVNKTINEKEGRKVMTDKEKFEGFKKNLIDENERKYGKEIREKYGDGTVNASNEKLMNISKEQYEEFEQLGKMILDTLEAAMETGNPAGDLAQKACDMHKKWLLFTWKNYTNEAHAGLADMYVEDHRFTAYYDQRKIGMAKFLRDAIYIYTGINK